MSVEPPSTRATDRNRIALAALFLYVITAAMLLSLNAGDSDDPNELTPDAGSGFATGGTTHLVSNEAQWDAAVAAAAPGDVIRLTATMTVPLIYEGGDDGGQPDGANGTAAAPIVITADPGVWIDLGAFETNGWAGLNIRYASHVHVDGVRVRNAQYGIRCLQCTGTATSPVRIVNSTTTETGYVGIHVGGHLATHAPSTHVLVEGNTISNTGRLIARFGEGIYVGHGGQEWVDETAHVVVRNNEISYTSAEGIDIKPGTREIVIEDNLIHHVAPIDGGSISAHYVNGATNPKPNEIDRVLIRRNRIWNQNLNGASGASDAAVWVGHGGVELVNNLVWGFRIHPNSRAVRVQAKANFGPHPVRITDNVFWTERGWVAEGSHGPTAIVVSSGNVGPSTTGIDHAVTIDAFAGPVPPLGQGGNADAGSGPGSGLDPWATTFVPTTPTTAPSTTAPPTTQPPITQPPTTQPPTTQPPTTQAPTTQPPTTQPPTTPTGGTGAPSTTATTATTAVAPSTSSAIGAGPASGGPGAGSTPSNRSNDPSGGDDATPSVAPESVAGDPASGDPNGRPASTPDIAGAVQSSEPDSTVTPGNAQAAAEPGSTPPIAEASRAGESADGVTWLDLIGGDGNALGAPPAGSTDVDPARNVAVDGSEPAGSRQLARSRYSGVEDDVALPSATGLGTGTGTGVDPVSGADDQTSALRTVALPLTIGCAAALAVTTVRRRRLLRR